MGSYVDGFQKYLDRFLPASGQKCELFSCTPGKVWLALAVLSLVGSASFGWQSFLKTIVWEIIVGWGIAWLCRGCSYEWLWLILVVFAGIPLALVFGSLVAGINSPSCGCTLALKK